jgi:ABC transporter with metal-binding/Fe-S-binding domain ATP-binding protein
MKVAALFSGGKDSVFSIYIAKQHGWEVTHLITLIPEKNSWMFHSLNLHISPMIAEAIGIPIIQRKTRGEKEKELEDLKCVLKNLEIDGVISGALASEYQRTRIERVCYDLELKSFTPLWHKDQALILKNQIDAGFEIMVVGIFAYGLDKAWLGRILDRKSLEDLINLRKKYGINIAGEGGELETLVLNGPLFKRRIILDETSIESKRESGFLKVKRAHIQ